MNDPLTPREVEVARLMALGRNKKEIAYELGITPRTADFHRMNIFKKLGVCDVVPVVYWALRTKLVTLEDAA